MSTEKRHAGDLSPTDRRWADRHDRLVGEARDEIARLNRERESRDPKPDDSPEVQS